jgi:hypothetical protein
MIKMLTAFTEEIDEIEAAVEEILEQLDIEKRLLTNSVGIVHCCGDFPENGVIKALYDSLPFEIAGMTSTSVGGPSIMGELALTLTVLTSDDITFRIGASSPITDKLDGPIDDLYARLIANQKEKPALLMPFVPFMLNIGGDEFMAKLDALSGGLPAFGSLAISNERDFSRIYTMYNDEYWTNSLVLLTLTGEVNPEFMSVSMLDENVLQQKAVVTASDRNILQSINNMPAVKYLETIGLASDGKIKGNESMPFVIDVDDGSRLIRACVGSTEEGYAICCGGIPVGARFGIATMGPDDVISSTESLVQDLVKKSEGKSIMIYSCVARQWTLGTKAAAEQEKAAEVIGDSCPYHFTYSGGEIFPVRLNDGSMTNLLQNESLIACFL